MNAADRKDQALERRRRQRGVLTMRLRRTRDAREAAVLSEKIHKLNATIGDLLAGHIMRRSAAICGSRGPWDLAHPWNR